MITLVLVVRDNNGDLVGVLTGVLGVRDLGGDCVTTPPVDCAGVLPLLLLLLATNTKDFGDERFVCGLVGDLVEAGFLPFPGLFLFSFFDIDFSNLPTALEIFLRALPLPLDNDEAKYTSKLDCDKCRFLVEEEEVDGEGSNLESVVSSSCSG